MCADRSSVSSYSYIHLQNASVLYKDNTTNNVVPLRFEIVATSLVTRTSTTVRTFFFQVVESATLAHYKQVDE